LGAPSFRKNSCAEILILRILPAKSTELWALATKMRERQILLAENPGLILTPKNRKSGYFGTENEDSEADLNGLVVGTSQLAGVLDVSTKYVVPRGNRLRTRQIGKSVW
jgi:hypothetical protein